MKRARTIMVMLTATLAAAWPPAAQAYVAPGATVLSASLERLEQADDTTTQVALSGDGRYAAFTTRARNFFADDDADPDGHFRAGGIFRRDLVSGALELVAHGDLRSDADPDRALIRGALNPSLSSDGRFVAFSTGFALVPEDANGNVDVYVRDMTVPATAPGAFELVSVTDAGTPAAYAPAPEGQDRPGVNPGSELTVRGAISGDGRRVVFKTADVVSDLPGGGGAPTTAGQQVFVRDRAARRTHLVTRASAGGEPAGGALGAAVLSADGSTVLWVGRNAPAQTAFLPGEGENPAFEYYLWRRIDDAGAPTRRITGIVDPDDPACLPGTPVIDNPNLLGPCYGPLASYDGHLGGIINQIPSLSADGSRAAFLTNAAPRGLNLGGNAADLFVADLRPGVGRKATTVELTRDGGATSASNAAIDGVAMSADGRWAAVTTQRTDFSLSAVRLLGTPRSAATARELLLIDIDARTIERASLAPGGADASGAVNALPAISDDGRRIAFISAASNLFFGDANNRADAFAVERLDAPPPEAPDPVAADDGAPVDGPIVDAAPEPPAPTRITVRAARGGKGFVRLRVKLPEKATGRVTANGRLRNAAGRKIGRTRVLATTKVAGKKASTVTVKLPIAKKLRGRLRVAGALTASARVELTGASGTKYLGRVTVEFRP